MTHDARHHPIGRRDKNKLFAMLCCRLVGSQSNKRDVKPEDCAPHCVQNLPHESFAPQLVQKVFVSGLTTSVESQSLFAMLQFSFPLWREPIAAWEVSDNVIKPVRLRFSRLKRRNQLKRHDVPDVHSMGTIEHAALMETARGPRQGLILRTYIHWC